jgi:hypothetical protein
MLEASHDLAGLEQELVSRGSKAAES